MAARWPYGLLLALLVPALVGHAWEPFAAIGYVVGLPLLGLATWYAVTRQSPFRRVLVTAFALMGAGLVALGLAVLLGLAAFNRGMFAAEETAGWLGFLGLVVLPVLGLVTGLAGLAGALFRPGVKVERVPAEPVGGID